jgi:hypothetical protein
MRELDAKADEPGRRLLYASFDTWKVYQQKQCGLEFDTTRAMHHEYSQHGTMGTKVQRRCQLRLNEGRLIELQSTDR